MAAKDHRNLEILEADLRGQVHLVDKKIHDFRQALADLCAEREYKVRKLGEVSAERWWQQSHKKWLPDIATLLEGTGVEIPRDYRVWFEDGPYPKYSVSYGDLHFWIVCYANTVSSVYVGSLDPKKNRDGAVRMIPFPLLRDFAYSGPEAHADVLSRDEKVDKTAPLNFKSLLEAAKKKAPGFEDSWAFGLLLFCLWTRWTFKRELCIPVWSDLFGRAAD